MDRHRGDRSGDRQGDRCGDGGRRTSSRWSSDNPTHQHHRYPRGGGASEGFYGGGRGGGPGRCHPYRVPQDFPAAPPPISGGEGFRSGCRGGGSFDPSMQMGGPRRGGFSGRGAPPTGRAPLLCARVLHATEWPCPGNCCLFVCGLFGLISKPAMPAPYFSAMLTSSSKKSTFVRLTSLRPLAVS
ncbi:hypothetical protein B296_00052255 [Ensete ventricosum]|uniref:Uncharacterized protein n=1 Tax=Ensete ventricosum TaxID=4639 RepID=A0A426X529_ENSVE|nr:hypothetical protein B296_00052255 [Ensete ventricosum]